MTISLAHRADEPKPHATLKWPRPTWAVKVHGEGDAVLYEGERSEPARGDSSMHPRLDITVRLVSADELDTKSNGDVFVEREEPEVLMELSNGEMVMFPLEAALALGKALITQYNAATNEQKAA